jgi:hypothetical protein
MPRPRTHLLPAVLGILLNLLLCEEHLSRAQQVVHGAQPVIVVHLHSVTKERVTMASVNGV